MPKPSKHKIRHVVRKVYETPWAILPAKLEEITELLDLRAAGEMYTAEEIEARIGALHERSPTANQSAGGVAVLDLFGVIAQRMNALEQVSGGTSTEQFGAAFDAAIADPDIETIVLNVDSPGGAVTGVPELAAKIRDARGKKRIIAVAHPLMASAAVWIGVQADEVVAQPTAQIGSIGVMAIHTDRSGADEQAGIKRTVIKSAEFKGELQGPLTEAAQEHAQERVNKLHRQFVAAVADARGVAEAAVERDFGRGRLLLADEALSVGLIDRIATFQEVLQELGIGAGSTTRNSARRRPAFVSKVSKEAMEPKILTALVRRGLCDVDADEAVARAALGAYFAARGEDIPEDASAVVAALNDKTTQVVQVLEPATLEIGQPATSDWTAQDLLAAIGLTSLSAEQQLELQNELLPQLETLSSSEVVKKINEAVVAATPTTGATRIESVVAERDKFLAAGRDAILQRHYGANLPVEIYDFRSGEMQDYNPVRGNRQLGSLLRLAEHCLMQAGVPQVQVSSLDPQAIARMICGSDPGNFGIFASSDGPAYNVSGMFSNILLDAANVMLRRSYTEANTTFEVWARQAPSIADFKDVHKVIAGELDDPKAVPEDGEFEETTHTDGKEKYALEVWGQIFSITWQAIVNDQLSAFTEIPTKQGRAMRRKQNKLVYQVLKDNAALQNDGIALFEANTHKNLTTGSAVPSVTTLNVMEQKMAEQTGLNSATTLNLEPKYILAGRALRGTILELLGSTANPASPNGNAGVTNIWQNGLEPVFDAQLGAAQGGSDTGWYLAADQNEVDTVEYAYLQGLESPALERVEAFTSLAIRFRQYIAFATKAIDFRGLQKHNGV